MPSNPLVTALPLASALAAPLAAQAAFLEDAQVNVLNRNYYFSQDYRNGDSATNPYTGERQSRRAEWAHGVIARAESGFTEGTVGVGLDVHGYLAVKLDGGEGLAGNGVAGPGLLSRHGYAADGPVKDEYGKAGAALKLRAFDTELRVGDVRPTSPLVYASDIRLLPQTLRGAIFHNTSVEGLTLQGGKLDSSSDRNASNHRGDLGTAYAGRFADANDVVYLGADYAPNERLSIKLHASRLDDIWDQQFFRVDYVQPLGERLAFNGGLHGYRTREAGSALLGGLDNDTWALRAGLTWGGHGVELSYTRVDGDTPFDYVWNTYDIELPSASQVSDFNNPNERIWQARYDYNFADLGVPGLTLTARYVRGTDIDGRNAGPAYAGFTGIADGKHWERNLWVKYVVQGGPAKDLSLNVMQATHRVGGDHTAEANIDELRVILEYPLDLRLL